MPPAARVGDPTSHPGTIAGPGATTVLIGGRPAAVVGTLHSCAMPPRAGPHPPTPIVRGSATVLISGQPAARMGDIAGCGALVVAGLVSVSIGG
ncbi:MAG TPA: PAAR domain-containing protein [Roseiflexaceae bacterium]